MNQHRNKEIWQLNDKWEWELIKDLVIDQENAGDKQSMLSPLEECTDFVITAKKYSTDHIGRYILIGRGYM